MLNLNNQNIKLKGLTITASQQLASEDASGQSSSTDVAETGTKAKMLIVSGYVKYTDAENLTQIFNLGEATEDGARIIYRISNSTAEALNIKQVRFANHITAAEQETTRQWRVNFTLAEVRSVPQKIEERQPETVAAVQGTGEPLPFADLKTQLETFSGLRQT